MKPRLCVLAAALALQGCMNLPASIREELQCAAPDNFGNADCQAELPWRGLPLRQAQIIVIEEHDEFAGCTGQTSIAGRRTLAVWALLKMPNPRVAQRAQEGSRIVGGVIVHNDKFPVFKRLFLHCRHGFRQHHAAVTGRNHHGN